MAAKFLFAVVFAAVFSQGLAVTTIWLDDVTSSHVTSVFHPKSIGIPKHYLFDHLVGCHIIYPNGQIYEAFPTDRVPAPAAFVSGSYPFEACSIVFNNPPVSMSGTYELLSQVRHIETNTETLTRQKYHITFIESDIWSKNFVKALKAASESS